MMVSASGSTARGTGSAAAVLAITFGLIFAVIWPDFLQRDWQDIPASDWIHTANRTDAYGAMRVAGGVSAACTLVFSWSFQRLWHV